MEKDKKYNLILGLMIFFFIILVAGCLAWGLGYISFGKVSTKNSNNMDNKADVSVANNSETKKDAKNSLEEAYKKYDFNWLSKNKSEIDITHVEDGKVILTTAGKKQTIEFNYGTPVMSSHIPGQAFDGIVVLNEKGEVYKIEFLSADNTKYEAKKINITEKVVDISSNGGKGAIPYYGPCYMTESGKVVDGSGRTYEEVNKDHVAMEGTIEFIVYICADNTVDLPRTETEYIKVIDRNNVKIKGSKVFASTVYDKTVIFIIDDAQKIWELNIGNNGVAYEYSLNIVKDLEFNSNAKYILNGIILSPYDNYLLIL